MVDLFSTTLVHTQPRERENPEKGLLRLLRLPAPPRRPPKRVPTTTNGGSSGHRQRTSRTVPRGAGGSLREGALFTRGARGAGHRIPACGGGGPLPAGLPHLRRRQGGAEVLQGRDLRAPA